MARRFYPENIYISPCFAIKRFVGLRQKYGNMAALTKSEFKPEREAWITGVFLLGLTKISGRKFWLRINNEDNSPDTVTMSPVERDKGVVAEMQNVEIFGYGPHSKDDLVAAIQRKLRLKAYSDNYILLCYVYGRTGEVFNTREIFTRVNSLNPRPKIAEIWVLANLSGNKSSEHVIFQVFPRENGMTFDYLKMCRDCNQEEIINPSRGMAKKVEFIPKGKVHFRLP